MNLVVKEYTQTYSIDFFETFAPIALVGTIQFIISVAIHDRWGLYRLDVKNIFLYVDLTERMYVQQLPGFEN